ncbi:MAG: MFS transporter [Actinobacteria bacterium]|nr:MFS transporter [Actinomycetota bacterium]
MTSQEPRPTGGTPQGYPQKHAATLHATRQPGSDEPSAVGRAGASRRSSFLGDLRIVWAEHDFRRLFSTRLISQTGDGLFTAGLGGYVFFSSTNFPNPASGAVAFSVLYLPYSLIGPFAGVFIDRWSRRQILLWSALLRSVFVAGTAGLMATGELGFPLYVGVLCVLGVNRFFLSALSAALPHVVPEDKLVMANAVSPTAGGIMTAIGGLAGLGVHIALHGGRGEYAATLLAAGCCYVAAGLVSLTMPRELLGPRHRHGVVRSSGIRHELVAVARGLVAGARYIFSRRGPASALGATGGNRIFYGILLLMSILLWRNYFYRGESANTALSHYAVLTLIVSVGYGTAAFVTPIATRWLTKRAWITALLAASAIVTISLGPPFTQPAFMTVGFFVGLSGQGVAICATTILQEQITDDYRGRAFSFYDMFFNALFVGGAAISVAVMPATGRTVALMVIIAIGYAVASAGYWLASRPAPAVG